jgi:putative IMPACT (imprinted ancient) family translation regulator
MHTLPEQIKTLTADSEFSLKEKGSEFNSFSRAITHQQEAVDFLSALRKKYFDASHHCYSWRLAGGAEKYSDDGEPNGTAGIRIQNAQNHFKLTNLITVVVRYFGGVKLGVGPLGKRYYETAYQNLARAKITEKTLFREITISYAFDQIKNLHYLISKYRIIQKEIIFDPDPVFKGIIPSHLAEPCLCYINDRFTPYISVKLIDSFHYK